jgi:hypothetical protein
MTIGFPVSREAWSAFKVEANPKRLAQAFETANNANSKGGWP